MPPEALKSKLKLPKASQPLLTFYFLQSTGILNQKSEQKSAQEQMMTNPDLMSGMMKQNLSGIVPQVSSRLPAAYVYMHGAPSQCCNDMH